MPVNATAEPLEGNKVKLSVEVDEATFEEAIDQAFRTLSAQVRIPGFRPGKAPRKVIEKRVGVAAAREQAIRDALPDYFAQAAIDTDTDAIAPPEIDITSGREEGPLAFDAVVEVRPKVEISGYQDLEVTVPSPLVADHEVDGHIDRLRRQSAQLETVTRSAGDGDQVRIDIRGTHGGEEVSGLTADDYLYEVGSGSVVPELDDQLRGAKPGDIFEFDAPVPGEEEAEPLHFRILVKEVQELVLPEVTDDWAAEASEFDTVAELRDDIVRRLGGMKRVNAVLSFRNAVVDAVAALVDEEPPEALVNYEMQERLHQLHHRLEAQGATIEQYLAATGKPPEEISAELRASATQAVKADLALRAVAEAEGLAATDDDLERELEKAAERTGTPVEEIRRQLERDDRVFDVRSDITKGKAVDWLLEHVRVVDEAGVAIDRSLLEPPDDIQPGHIDAGHDDHDHHDHDHHDQSGEAE